MTTYFVPDKYQRKDKRHQEKQRKQNTNNNQPKPKVWKVLANQPKPNTTHTYYHMSPVDNVPYEEIPQRLRDGFDCDVMIYDWILFYEVLLMVPQTWNRIVEVTGMVFGE